jgi:hypothetical protein
MKESIQTAGLTDAKFVAKLSQPRITLVCIQNYTEEKPYVCDICGRGFVCFASKWKEVVCLCRCCKSFVVHIHHTQI